MEKAYLSGLSDERWVRPACRQAGGVPRQARDRHDGFGVAGEIELILALTK